MSSHAYDILALAKRCDPHLVEQLLRADPTQVGATDVFGRTPLHLAATGAWAPNGVETVAVLIAAGADVGAKSRFGSVVDEIDSQLEQCVDERPFADWLRVAKAILQGQFSQSDPTDPESELIANVAARNGLVGLAGLVIDRGGSMMQEGARTPLSDACEGGHLALAELLLAAGASPNGQADDYPLHLAARNGHLDVVAALLEHGVDVGIRDRDGATALHLAAGHGWPEVTQKLVSAGADMLALDRHGNTWDGAARSAGYVFSEGLDECLSVHAAAGAGDALTLRTLVSRDRALRESISQRPPHRGLTPLQSAVACGQTDCVRALLECGADPESNSSRAESPISLAARHDRPVIAGLLLDAGANPDRAKEHGCRPICIAAQNGSTDVINLLLHAGVIPAPAEPSPQDPIREALLSRHDITAATLIAAAPVRLDRLAILAHDAITGGLAESAAMLVSLDGARKCRDPRGRTLLHVACQVGRVPVVKQLLALGASVEDVDLAGTTPLMLAAMGTRRSGTVAEEPGTRDRVSDHVRTVEHLIAAGADVNARSASGQTALHLATQQGHLAVVRRLLLAGADPGAQTKCGQTPEDVAGRSAVRTLLSSARGGTGTQPGAPRRSVRGMQGHD